MISKFAMVLLATVGIAIQQPPSKIDLLKRLDDLDAAITANDWRAAAELSISLKKGIQDVRIESAARGGREHVELVLNWLPADTETIVVAQQPFQLSTTDRNTVPTGLSGARSYVLQMLSVAENKTLRNQLEGRTVRSVTMGARNFAFRTQGGLGMVGYQGCAVYAFEEPLGDSVLSRDRDELLSGYPVWISKDTQDTYFVTQVKDDVIVACNHREFFTEVVSRIIASAIPRALPVTLPEWTLVDRTAPLWAIRHYRQDRAKRDPSTVIGLLGANVEATGIVVEFGMSDSVLARMISMSDPWRPLMDRPDLNSLVGGVKSRETVRGVWDLEIVGNPRTSTFASFALMGVLGFVVVI